MRRAFTLAGVLILAALALGILAVILRALRWLLIVAAILVVIGAVVGSIGRSRNRRAP